MGCLVMIIGIIIVQGGIAQIGPEYYWVGWLVIVAGMLWYNDNDCKCKE